jgi:hypothetical protein
LAKPPLSRRSILAAKDISLLLCALYHGGTWIIRMSPRPEPSTQEVLAGLVERVTYHNAENGFCVVRARARGHRDVVTVVGHAATISAGELITASGEWVQ